MTLTTLRPTRAKIPAPRSATGEIEPQGTPVSRFAQAAAFIRRTCGLGPVAPIRAETPSAELPGLIGIGGNLYNVRLSGVHNGGNTQLFARVARLVLDTDSGQLQPSTLGHYVVEEEAVRKRNGRLPAELGAQVVGAALDSEVVQNPWLLDKAPIHVTHEGDARTLAGCLFEAINGVRPLVPRRTDDAGVWGRQVTLAGNGSSITMHQFGILSAQTGNFVPIEHQDIVVESGAYPGRLFGLGAEGFAERATSDMASLGRLDHSQVDDAFWRTASVLVAADERYPYQTA